MKFWATIAKWWASDWLLALTAAAVFLLVLWGFKQ